MPLSVDPAFLLLVEMTTFCNLYPRSVEPGLLSELSMDMRKSVTTSLRRDCRVRVLGIVFSDYVNNNATMPGLQDSGSDHLLGLGSQHGSTV